MGAGNSEFSPGLLALRLEVLPRGGTYWVAFSGGPDSTALLQALTELQPPLQHVRVVHVNHGMHPESGDWAEHCASFCAERGLELRCLDVSPDPASGRGPEAEMRRLRYAAMAALLSGGDVLLTAHHSGDQAETLLLNLMRGSGVEGLAGISELRPLGDAWLARPLLGCSSESLKAFLRDRGIEWIEDPANRDPAFDRNFIRHELLPVFRRRWPHAVESLARSARHSREAADILAAYADSMLTPRLVTDRVLDIAGLATSDDSLLKLMLRRWIRTVAAPSMPAMRLTELCRQLEHAAPGSNITTRWQGWMLRHFHQQLWLYEEAAIGPCPDLSWSGLEPVDLGPGIGVLKLTPHPDAAPAAMRVRPRMGGEKIDLDTRRHRQSVKNLLRDAAIPPWLRDSIPLLELDGETVAIGDWAIGSRLRTWLAAHRVRLDWTPADPALRLVRTLCHRKTVEPF